MTHVQLLHWLTIVLASLISHPDSKSKIITWPAPAEIDPSAYFLVQANNENVFVYDSPNASYAMFDFEGTADFKIKAGRDVTFKDIFVTDGLIPFSIFCEFDEEHQVENITIDNLVVHGKKITTLEEAKVYQDFTKNLQIR